MKLYTRMGDSGTTSLVGGERVGKGSVRIEAYGELDELTAHLGFLTSNFELPPTVRQQMVDIISRTMDCAAIVACKDTTVDKLPSVGGDDVARLELYCDSLMEGLAPLHHFTLPVGCPAMSYAHVCRTVARRAERALVRLTGDEGDVVPAGVACYVNRLSDYLYALTRSLTQLSGQADVLWSAKGR